MRMWLAHSSGRRKLWEYDHEQAMFVEEVQSAGGFVWPKDCIQFVMHAFRSYLWKQSRVTCEQALGPGVYLKLVAHHQPDSSQHTQGIMAKDLVIDRFQAAGL